MTIKRCTLWLVTLALFVSRPVIASDEEKAVSIISEPSGARVVINGRDQGITPLEIKVGHWAFDTKKSTAFSKHLSEPWILQISKDGYRSESLDMTRGPFLWRSFNARNSFRYWVLNSPSYTVKLRPGTRVMTNKDVLDLLQSGIGDSLIIEKIQTSSCEFKTDPEDITALHGARVPDSVIAAMMHAVPVEQSGPATGIQPAKKQK